jgi:hypothetical protein
MRDLLRPCRFQRAPLVILLYADRRTEMNINWIKARPPRSGLDLARHPVIEAEFLETGATAGGIVCGMALLLGAMPVVSVLGAIWFLIIQPALH